MSRAADSQTGGEAPMRGQPTPIDCSRVSVMRDFPALVKRG
jgi:hypothetical protein